MGRLVSWALLVGGALLIAQGSFSVYPFLSPSGKAPEFEARRVTDSKAESHPEPASYIFQLSLPRQRISIPVVEGTTDDALRRGPGHLEGSPMPGAPGNSVIAGHRDTHFRVLKDVSLGDRIVIDRGASRYEYEIVDLQVVPPTDTSSLRPERDSVLTLITCYPFYFIGPAPKRFVVRAKATGSGSVRPEILSGL
jgi:sortase A